MAEFEAIGEKVAAARDLFGRLDILVNVAGITGSTPIEEITPESWDRMMDIDLKSMFFVTQAVFSVMKEQHYGKLVHMSSLAALRGRKKFGCFLRLCQSGYLESEQMLCTPGSAVSYHLQRCLPWEHPYAHG